MPHIYPCDFDVRSIAAIILDPTIPLLGTHPSETYDQVNTTKGCILGALDSQQTASCALMPCAEQSILVRSAPLNNVPTFGGSYITVEGVRLER